MNILIIDNNIDQSDWGSPLIRQWVHTVAAENSEGINIHVRRGPHDDLPASARTFSQHFDKLIISGSKTSALDDAPWIEKLHQFIRDTAELGKPILGICYGHQSLIRAFGSKENVRISAVPEFGWSQIHVSERNLLMDGLGDSFYSYSSHFDEVANLPAGFRRIAKSEYCEIQGCELIGKPVFGIQFHPEKDLAGATHSLNLRKKSGTPKTLINADRGKELFSLDVGNRIFSNFIKISL